MEELMLKAFYSVVIGGVAAIRSSYRRHASKSWPEVQGTVDREIRFIPPGGSHLNAQLGLAFYYVVEGEYYSGEVPLSEVVGYGMWDAMQQQRFKPGSKLRVRYRPGKPTVSVAFATR